MAAPSLVSVIGIMSPPSAKTVAKFLIRLVTLVEVIVDHLVVCPGRSGGPVVGGDAFPRVSGLVSPVPLAGCFCISLGGVERGSVWLIEGPVSWGLFSGVAIVSVGFDA